MINYLLDFKNSYIWIIVGSIIVLSIIVFLIIYFIAKKQKDNDAKKIAGKYLKIIEALGGKGNITSVSSMGSRLNFVLKNNEIDENLLIELGISNILKSNSKITLVIGELASTLENEIKRML